MKQDPIDYYSPTVEKITKYGLKCSVAMGISFAALKSKSRKREIVLRRQITMTLCVELVPEAPLAIIGGVLGEKDHATVLHAIKTVNNLIVNNVEANALYFTCRKKLNLGLPPEYCPNRDFVHKNQIRSFLGMEDDLSDITIGSVMISILKASERKGIHILFFCTDGIIIKSTDAL